ncbi:hypothetical protein EYC84_005337 [Monilinia fructicola]|uniref:Uncharacterized protein n=1 Tax=Monilinia fructicola TaxID=38448 RepID=A0A5M9K4L6_MONFR|nr:hypothetical protein EYC84_005337 [Monilinia fructicola]
MPFQHPLDMCLVVTFAVQIEKIKDKMLFDEFDVLTFIYFHLLLSLAILALYFNLPDWGRAGEASRSCISHRKANTFSYYDHPPTNSTKSMLLVTLVRVSYAGNGKFAESQPD